MAKYNSIAMRANSRVVLATGCFGINLILSIPSRANAGKTIGIASTTLEVTV